MGQYEQLYDELLSFRTGQAERGGTAQDGASLPTAELGGVDRDLIHIPFLRLSALGQYDELAAAAEDYIVAYPRSPVGYHYRAEAAWRQGDQKLAVSLYKNVLGNDVSDAVATEVVTRTMAQDPIDVLARMKPE
jgi:hypothetical protein